MDDTTRFLKKIFILFITASFSLITIRCCFNIFFKTVDELESLNVVPETLEEISPIPTVIPTKAATITPIPTQVIIRQETTVIHEAKRIDYRIPLMAVIILVAVVIVLCFIVFMYKLYVDKKKREWEYNKQILQTPLDTFESAAVNELKKKYDE